MAKAIYNGVDNVARQVKQPYIGVDNVSRKVTDGYIGVDNVARKCFPSGVPISELPVGASVYMIVQGVSTEFLVVHQGLPSDAYDASCDGTWLLMRNLYGKKAWGYGDNIYSYSELHSYLNNTILSLFDSEIQSIIKQVKIPYVANGGILEGYNGISAKIFIPSAIEVGFNIDTNPNMPNDGACLDYFIGTTYNDPKRIAYYNETATDWWLRSPELQSTEYAWYVEARGYSGTHKISSFSHGIRPTLILPCETLVDSSFNVIAQ